MVELVGTELLNNRRIQLVLLAVAVALFLIFMRDLNPSTVDLNFGIEFVGGVRIPLSLEHAVEPDQMQSIVDTIKTRINAYGLSQAIVRPLGNQEVIVEIPQADSTAIKRVESILKKQGKFEAVIDGKLALSGSDVMTSSVGGPSGEEITVTGEQGEWRLTFAVTAEGQERFSTTAQGKKGYPVYMFLDRPENALLLVNRSVFGGDVAWSTNQRLVDAALRKDGDDIKLFFVEDYAANKQRILESNSSEIVVSDSLKASNPEIISDLTAAGFVFQTSEAVNPERRIIEKTDAELAPQFSQTGTPNAVLFSWSAIGLRSAPVLSFQPVISKTIAQYSITGGVTADEKETAQEKAVLEIKEIKSVLTGGKLPVSTIVGSYYDVEPALGKNFLYYSVVGILAALVLVSAVITLRYRKLYLVWPILLTVVIELMVLVALVGTIGTLDLAAMAGVIALIGTGVNDQIIITDELLRKKKEEEPERSTKEKLARAFFIVFTVAGVAIAAMVPLLLSGIVEISGFALSTIIGVIVGVSITRPAYGALVELLVQK